MATAFYSERLDLMEMLSKLIVDSSNKPGYTAEVILKVAGGNVYVQQMTATMDAPCWVEFGDDVRTWGIDDVCDDDEDWDW